MMTSRVISEWSFTDRNKLSQTNSLQMASEYLIHGINNNNIKALIVTNIASGMDLDNPVTRMAVSTIFHAPVVDLEGLIASFALLLLAAKRTLFYALILLFT